MSKAFKESRLIGMLALLAGFMAVSASAAQAEGFWLKNGVAITGNTTINTKAEDRGHSLNQSEHVQGRTLMSRD